MADGLKKGDVVLNGWAVPGFNDLHIITGSTTRKTSRYTTSSFYKSRCLFKGKLGNEWLFSKSDNRLTKIGHIDYEGYIIKEMERLREAAPPNN